MVEEYENKQFNKVTKLMLSLMFKPHMQGFDFLRSAVLYCLDEGSCKRITTQLYPEIARKYNTKPASVERNIRKCVESAYLCGGLLTLNTYFDAIVYKNDFCFSNGEMIAIMVEIINLDDQKQKFCKALLADE